MENKKFENKWSSILEKAPDEEFSIWVPPGGYPRTQRQFNLFNYFEFFKNVIGDRPYRTSLEMGCGRGTMSCYMNAYLGYETTLMDLSEEAIALARRNFEVLDMDATFVVADSKATGLPDEQFDVVCSIGLLEHFDDYHLALEETYRLLNPGGVMISLNIPKKRSIQMLNNVYRKCRAIKTSETFNQDYYRNPDRPADFLRKTKAAGFVDSYTMNVCPYPIFTPLSIESDQRLTKIYRGSLAFRRMFMRYPFKSSYWCSQAHFLVGFKPA